MGRLELHPVDPGLLAISPQPCDRVLQRSVEGIAGVTLRHHHEIGIELVLHVHRRTIAGNRLIEGYDLHSRALRLALAFDWLVVDADPGYTGADAFPHHTAHRHDAAVPGVTIQDHRDRHTVGNPTGDRYALGHCRGADIRKPGIGAYYSSRADEQCLAASFLHDPGVRRARRM